MPEITVIGGGLAGCEAAWQAAQRGVRVRLYEMRPAAQTGAHLTGNLAELVCSNSLGAIPLHKAAGLLKEETRLLGSLLLECAEQAAIPAGGALAVDRDAFSQAVMQRITAHPNIQIIREEVTALPDGIVVIASGPLTSPALTRSIQALTGEDNLFFYDAAAPIVTADTINMEIAYRASRYGKGSNEAGDYLNLPFTLEQYRAFTSELVQAQRVRLHEFEQEIPNGVRAGSAEYFEGCLPVEVIAARGQDSLAFGPLRPVGLRDPRTGQRPHAVLQLRQDNLAGTLYNLVGFQTNLTFPEQKRVFRMIPGLEKAEFARFGQMHRNTYIASPRLLDPSLQLKQHPNLFFAGQITGVEGYMGNIATGLLAGVNAVRYLRQQPLLTLPRTTMLGALCYYVTHADLADFQPMKANFGLILPLKLAPQNKLERFETYAHIALTDLSEFLRLLPDFSAQ